MAIVHLGADGSRTEWTFGQLKRASDGLAASLSARGVARVPDDQIDTVVEAAEECPGECIMIEPYDEAIVADRGV